jgi:hypothetical protein
VGQRYGTIFHMVPDKTNRKLFQLEVAKEVLDFERLFLTGRHSHQVYEPHAGNFFPLFCYRYI